MKVPRCTSQLRYVASHMLAPARPTRPTPLPLSHSVLYQPYSDFPVIHPEVHSIIHFIIHHTSHYTLPTPHPPRPHHTHLAHTPLHLAHTTPTLPTPHPPCPSRPRRCPASTPQLRQPRSPRHPYLRPRAPPPPPPPPVPRPLTRCRLPPISPCAGTAHPVGGGAAGNAIRVVWWGAATCAGMAHTMATPRTPGIR